MHKYLKKYFRVQNQQSFHRVLAENTKIQEKAYLPNAVSVVCETAKEGIVIFLFAFQKNKKNHFCIANRKELRGRKRNKIKSHRHCNAAAVVMMRLETSLPSSL